MPDAPPRAARPGRAEVVRRAAVTLAAVALVLAGERVPLPFLGDETWRMVAGRGPPFHLTPLALGVTPFVAGYLLVEIVAVVVPGLRRLREGSRTGRVRLARAAWAAALALAAWRGVHLVVTLRGMASLRFGDALEPGHGPELAVVAATVLGTAAIGVLALVASRHGLGNGFAVLVAVESVERLRLVAFRWLHQLPGAWSEASVVAGLTIAFLVSVIGGRARRAAAGAVPRVQVPTCGLVPLSGAAALVEFPSKLAEWLPAAAPLAAALAAREWPGWLGVDLVAVALATALALVFARLFAAPDAVVRSFRRASGDGADEETAAGLRGAAELANRRSVSLVAALALLPTAATLLGAPVYVGAGTVVPIAIVAAVARDLVDEVRARATAGALAVACPLQRTRDVAPVLEALAASGATAFARTRRFRTIFQFFAPYAPVEILVPPERRAEAEAICARVVGDAGAGSAA